MMLLLRCSTSDAMSGYEVALVRLDEAMKELILSRKRQYESIKAHAPDMMGASFWNSAPSFYAEFGSILDEDGKILLSDEEDRTFSKEGYAFLDDERAKTLFPDTLPEQVGPSRTDCERLTIDERGFFWRVLSKHGGGEWAETWRAPYSILESPEATP